MRAGTMLTTIPRPRTKAARAYPFVAASGVTVVGTTGYRAALREAVHLAKTVAHVINTQRGNRDPKPRIVATCIPKKQGRRRIAVCHLTEKPRRPGRR